MVSKTVSRTLLLASWLILGSANVAASPAAPLDDLVEVGSGEMRWFGMDLYAARLWSGDGRYTQGSDSGAVALEIIYRRHISRQRLVRTTGSEWDRLGRELGLNGGPQLKAWLAELADIWPDVTPGDRIIALNEPNGPTRFYGNDGLLGVIEDPEFGPAFLGIWLHPGTRAADLRAALIGAPR